MSDHVNVRNVVAGIVLGLICAIAGGVVIERFAFELPAPTGPFPVGTVTFVVDRPPSPFDADPGRFTVQVWYPGQPSNDRAPYGSGSPGLKRWVYHRLVGTHAARDAGFAELPGRAPVVIYVPAWNGERGDNTALLEELASHGFVVAAFGDVMFDDPPVRRLAGPLDFGSERAFEATKRLAHDKVQFVERRVSLVLDRLAQLDAADPAGRFTNRLDLEHAGVLGYSFGGAVAFAASRRDPRLKAAINMDGWIFDAATGYRGGVPYFLISDGTPLPGPKDLVSDDPELRYTSILTMADVQIQNDVLARGGYLLEIDDANHLSFSDVPLYAPLHRFGGKVALQIASAVRAYSLAFFEHELAGKPAPLLVPGKKTDPTMTLSRWPVAP